MTEKKNKKNKKNKNTAGMYIVWMYPITSEFLKHEEDS